MTSTEALNQVGQAALRRPGVAFIDGEYVALDDARLPVLDWGFLRGDATYDVAHLWEGRIFRLQDHLDRFFRGTELLRMSVPYSRSEVEQIVLECARRSGLTEGILEIVCTRGFAPSGMSRDPRDSVSRFIAFSAPAPWIIRPDEDRGLALRVSSVERISPRAVDPTVKNFHWLDFIRGLFDAYDHGADTTVLVDGGGHVTEGPGFNIFAVVKGRLITPDDGVLLGVTRRTVLEIAADMGLPAEERGLRVEELRAASEVFATSTAGGIIPIASIDGVPVSEQMPGPVTHEIRRRYWDLHRDPRFATEIPATP